ncbi:hypothetical protein AYO44_04680 [Planctomycetaceae bacterium SCGC AG-212-F19]|nr:hypothetical protein AYO44_04680 [Planctomycetaceae bacterium SCGC AG-212-F19]
MARPIRSLLRVAGILIGLVVLMRQDQPPGRSAEPEHGESVRQDAHGSPLPPGAVARVGNIRYRLPGVVSAFAVSPDGKQIATGTDLKGGAGEIYLWETATGEIVGKLAGNNDAVRGIAYLLDGKSLISVGNLTIRVLNLVTGQETRLLKRAVGGRDDHALTRDGKVVFAGGTNVVDQFDLATGEVVRKFAANPMPNSGSSLLNVAVSPDGRWLAGRRSSSVFLWDVATGKEVYRRTPHRDPAGYLAFSPDSKRLASGGFSNGAEIVVWDVASGDEIARWQTGGTHFGGLVFRRDSATLVSVGNDLVQIWDAATGKEQQRWPLKPPLGVFALAGSVIALANDDRTLIAGSFAHSLRFFDLTTGKERHPPQGHTNPIYLVAFGREPGTLLTRCYEGTLCTWDVAKGQEIHRLDLPKGALTADRKILAQLRSRDNQRTVVLTDVATRRELRNFDQSAEEWYLGMAFTPDGSRLATGGIKEIRVWETATGKELHHLVRPSGSGFDVAITPEGQWLAGRVWDGGVQLAHPASGAKRVLPCKADPLDPFAFSPDGRLLAAAERAGKGSDEPAGVALWDVATGEKRGRCPAGRHPIACLAFSADGRMLAAGSNEDRQLWLWEVASAQPRLTFPPQRAATTALGFAPDGGQLASAGADSTVLVWDLTGRATAAEPQRVQKLSAKQLDALWADLAGDTDAVVAYRAVQQLVASPQQAVPLLQDRLSKAGNTNAEIVRLVGQLDDDNFETREAATRALVKYGREAEPDLRRALTKAPSVEARGRLEGLLAKLKEGKPALAALSGVRGVEVLERISSPEARQLLATLSRGPANARLTREAQTALARLSVK